MYLVKKNLVSCIVWSITKQGFPRVNDYVFLRTYDCSAEILNNKENCGRTWQDRQHLWREIDVLGWDPSSLWMAWTRYFASVEFKDLTWTRKLTLLCLSCQRIWRHLQKPHPWWLSNAFWSLQSVVHLSKSYIRWGSLLPYILQGLCWVSWLVL